MAEENFSFSMGWAPTPPRQKDPTRYLAVPFDARAVDAGDVLLLPAGEHHSQRISMKAAQALSCCEGLRSLDDHARNVAQRLRLPPQQADAMRELLQQLVKGGLLLSEAALLERIHNDVGTEPGSIDLLFIRTCARPDTLRHLLESLAEQPADAGPRQCIVIDDANDEADRAATRSVVAELASRLDCELILVDRAARGRLLDHLAEATGADRTRLAWHFEGDPGEEQKTYGAGPNLALLLGAGRRFALMDDDASFHGRRAPDADTTPVFTQESLHRALIPGSEATSIEESLAAMGEHPLEAHALYLGQPAGALPAMAGDDSGSTLARLTPQLLFELLPQPRVRFTSSGVIGDPGTEDLHWLFAGDPEDFRTLCSDSAETGRARLFRRRVVRSSHQPEASPAFALMTTTLTGIDNRDLMLPTSAKGRNEDMLLGALAGYLYPGSLHMGLPHALEHNRSSARRWSEASLDHPRYPNRARYLFSWIEDLGEIVGADEPDARIALLESALGVLAREDIKSLKSKMARQLLEIQGSLVERLNVARNALKPPDWLALDFERVIRSSSHNAPDLDQRLNEVAMSTQHFAARYQASVGDWCKAWTYCRHEGIGPLLAICRRESR